MKRNPMIAALAALMLFAPTLSLATEYKDGHTPTNGLAPPGQPISGWDGSHVVNWRFDPFGIGRVTEEYPITTQFTSTSVASTQPVFWCLFTTLQPFGTVWTAAPYGQKTLYLTRTVTASSTVQTPIVYIFGSEDGATFYPVMVPKGLTTTGNQANWLTSFADTANMDTLKIYMPKRGGSVASGTFSIPDWVYLGRYVQLYATKSDTVATTAVTLSARWGGREK